MSMTWGVEGPKQGPNGDMLPAPLPSLLAGNVDRRGLG